MHSAKQFTCCMADMTSSATGRGHIPAHRTYPAAADPDRIWPWAPWLWLWRPGPRWHQFLPKFPWKLPYIRELSVPLLPGGLPSLIRCRICFLEFFNFNDEYFLPDSIKSKRLSYNWFNMKSFYENLNFFVEKFYLYSLNFIKLHFILTKWINNT